jgi:uncharacterized membrane protein YebE (DUF533 family)
MDQGGLDGIFGQLQNALGGAGAGGGFADRAKDFLRQDQVGGLSGAQIGGIGAAAGALLGGGLGGAARGGAMAVLGTLALGALKRAQASRQAGGGVPPAPAPVEEGEVRAVTGPESERLVLKAMISAAKADGQVDKGEMQKIIGKISADQVTPEEKQFVLDQLAGPLDVAGLAAEARNPAQAAQVYAASILAIDADTDHEKNYLHELATALRLDPATVAQLHRMTGAPA